MEYYQPWIGWVQNKRQQTCKEELWHLSRILENYFWRIRNEIGLTKDFCTLLYIQLNVCSHMLYVAVQAYTLTEQKQITEHAFSYLPTISVKHVLHVDKVSFDMKWIMPKQHPYMPFRSFSFLLHSNVCTAVTFFKLYLLHLSIYFSVSKHSSLQFFLNLASTCELIIRQRVIKVHYNSKCARTAFRKHR